MSPTNQAAWLTERQARPFKIDEAPMPVASNDEVVIRVHAVALNPVDWMIQATGAIVHSYPRVLGIDAAGEVESVGPSVKNLKPGDRIAAWTDCPPDSKGAVGTFQLYAKTTETMTVKIPDSLEFKTACMFPMTLCVAAVALFQKDTLALSFPSLDPKPKNEVVLIWAGSTNVGSYAIQMAKAAGYDVVTTASPRNFDLCKSLGAKWVFDYSSASVVDEVAAALSGEKFAGAMDAHSHADGPGKCAEIIEKLGAKKFVQTVLPRVFPKLPELPDGFELGFDYGTTLYTNEVGPAVWADWLPKALANGTLKCKPDPLVVGKGLEKIQEACDRGMKGVSAAKLVVELV